MSCVINIKKFVDASAEGGGRVCCARP